MAKIIHILYQSFMPDIRHLKHFVAVAEEKHFGLAAVRLNMTQPPLSLSIKKLEEELGVKLFDRTTKRVSLTSAGDVFLSGAYDALQRMDELTNDTQRAASGHLGRLKLGFVGSAIYEALPKTIRTFRKYYPDVQLDLKEMATVEQIEALSKNEIDVGILRPPITGGALYDLSPISEEAMVAVLPSNHPLAKNETIQLELLKDDAFILFPHNVSPNLHALVLLACREAGFTPNIFQTAPQIQTQISLVSAKLGVALVPACAARVRYPDVVFRPIEVSKIHINTQMSVVHRRDEKSAIVQSFVDLCKGLNK
jgi:DNA-binding transcriptional LysR family regulator